MPPGETEPIIRIQGVSKSFGDFQALKNVSLEVAPGERVVICGPSGSGKSTLIRCVNGLEQHQSGSIVVNGVELDHSPESLKSIKVQIGMVFQQFNLFPHLTVLENLTLGPIRARKMPKAEARDLAMRYLERVHIPEQADKYPPKLSGGQQQRVFLARALVSSPELLLLDEPTSGVDIKTRDDVMHLLHDLNHDGVTIIITTHEINAVAVHLPWVVCLAGRILAEGPPSEVITTEILKLTYGAEMPVIHYDGMTIVAEAPHSYASNGDGNGKTTMPPVHVHKPGGDPSEEASHIHETNGGSQAEGSTHSHNSGGDSEQEASHV